MNVALLMGMALGGGLLVHRTNQAYDRLRTCRYRDFFRLREQAEVCTAGYFLFGLVSLIFSGGFVVTTAVFSYALYRRFRE